MIDPIRRYAFIHIQKTAGTAVVRALGANPDTHDKHLTALETRDLVGAAEWSRLFTFSFVRNPWDRLVSWWSMIDQARAAPVNAFHRFVVDRARTFEEFLTRCDRDVADDDGRKWIYRNQIDYLSNPDGEIIVDFIGRFESLQSDFAAVATRILNTAVPLSEENSSQHEHYSSYYDRGMADHVAQRYARDIAAFGYRFEARS